MKTIWLLCALFLLNLQAQAATLSWEPSANATGYRIYNSIGTGPFVTLLTVTTTSAVVLPSTNTTTRYYTTAFNNGGESSPSNTVTNTPSVLPPPGPVISISALSLSATNVAQGQSVSFTGTIQNSGGSPFALQAGSITLLEPNATQQDGPYLSVATISATTIAANSIISVTGTWAVPTTAVLGPWRSYTVIQDANGVWTAGPITAFNVVANVPPPLPPLAPVNLRLNKINDTRLEISWDSSLLASHEVERNEQNAGFKLRATIGPGNLFYSDSIRRRRDYDYRVRARNAAGASPYSQVVSYNAP